MKYTFLLLAVIILAFGMVNCENDKAPKTLYERLERDALKSGERNDSLFLGLHFGMKKQDFYIHCAALNKDTILYQGMGGKVEYHIKNELKHSTRMTFYPEFNADEIWEIPVVFTYDGWAPWNRDYTATKLRGRVKTMMEDWYGGEKFVEIPHPTDTIALVKIDGNRRILLERDDVGTNVKATFTDLTVEKKLKEEFKKRQEEKAEEK
ncbi:MAG: hypothetical protein ACJAUH_000073 [Saprospiraceae bacterium]|jgi:hypothetical protein